LSSTAGARAAGIMSGSVRRAIVPASASVTCFGGAAATSWGYARSSGVGSCEEDSARYFSRLPICPVVPPNTPRIGSGEEGLIALPFPGPSRSSQSPPDGQTDPRLDLSISTIPGAFFVASGASGSPEAVKSAYGGSTTPFLQGRPFLLLSVRRAGRKAPSDSLREWHEATIPLVPHKWPPKHRHLVHFSKLVLWRPR
jgi:hypothetical protein